jgi:Zn finger protein HypA/HybF involved in hydrogenase expression
MLWLFCRRCAGLFKSPVIVALCPYCQSKRTHPRSA